MSGLPAYRVIHLRLFATAPQAENDAIAAGLRATVMPAGDDETIRFDEPELDNGGQ